MIGMKISRDEALKAVDDIFNYCEEIDNSLPENERSGYKMLPDIHKIRKYIVENTRPHGEWLPKYDDNGGKRYVCSICGEPCYTLLWTEPEPRDRFCLWCGADMRGEAE